MTSAKVPGAVSIDNVQSAPPWLIGIGVGVVIFSGHPTSNLDDAGTAVTPAPSEMSTVNVGDGSDATPPGHARAGLEPQVGSTDMDTGWPSPMRRAVSTG